MAISDLPGYAQGFIFSDASTATYDAGVFKNQSAYGPGPGGVADLVITAGTPAFTTINGQKVWAMDNTAQGGFVPALPWECAVIVVMRPQMSVNGTIYPLVAGQAAISSNGRIRIQRVPSYIHGLAMPNDTVTAGQSYGADTALKVTAFETSQENRRAYHTPDGVTVTATTQQASTTNGNAMAWCLGNTTTTLGLRVRVGNLSGTVGDVAVTTNKADVAEVHFFKAGLLSNSANHAALAAEMAALKTKYGI